MGKRDKERRSIKPAAWAEKVIDAANTNPEDMDITPSNPSNSDVQVASSAAVVSDNQESSQKRDTADEENEHDQGTHGSEEGDRKRQKIRKETGQGTCSQ